MSTIDVNEYDPGGSSLTVDDMVITYSDDNGGETMTMLPADDSPAISAGNPSITGAPTTDQRGVNRVEIGAVESTGITVPVTRSGAAEGPTSITLRSCDGVTRTLTWADGETGTETAPTPIPDNTTDDPDRACTDLPATGSSGTLLRPGRDFARIDPHRNPDWTRRVRSRNIIRLIIGPT